MIPIPKAQLSVAGWLLFSLFVFCHHVAAEGMDAARIRNLIDTEVAKRHRDSAEPFLSPCSDAAFVRRVYLDLWGTIPDVEEAKSFLENESPEKRTQLIKQMIADPKFGIRVANVWAPVLSHPELAWSLVPYRDWMGQQIQQGAGWDDITQEILTATGPQYGNPAVTMFLSFDKGRTLTPELATNIVGRGMMGIQIECAQCHDHPFISCSHSQYWGIAGFLGNTKLWSRWPEYGDAPSSDDYDVKGVRFGVQDAAQPRKRGSPLERSLEMAATFPDGQVAEVAPTRAREAFAEWLLASEYPYLARAFVNRTWNQLFGSGLVVPVDDHRSDNPPLYRNLRNLLMQEFREGDYDIRALFEGVCTSQTYQQQSVTHEDARDLRGTNLRSVAPDQVFEMIRHVLGDEAVTSTRGIEGYRGSRKAFVDSFGDDASLGMPTLFGKSTSDFLQMLNSHQLDRGIESRVAKFQSQWEDAAGMADQLYLLALSRYPSDVERQRIVEFVAKVPTQAEAYADVLWALLNSAEFYLEP